MKTIVTLLCGVVAVHGGASVDLRSYDDVTGLRCAENTINVWGYKADCAACPTGVVIGASATTPPPLAALSFKMSVSDNVADVLECVSHYHPTQCSPRTPDSSSLHYLFVTDVPDKAVQEQILIPESAADGDNTTSESLTAGCTSPNSTQLADEKSCPVNSPKVDLLIAVDVTGRCKDWASVVVDPTASESRFPLSGVKIFSGYNMTLTITDTDGAEGGFEGRSFIGDTTSLRKVLEDVSLSWAEPFRTKTLKFVLSAEGRDAVDISFAVVQDSVDVNIVRKMYEGGGSLAQCYPAAVTHEVTGLADCNPNNLLQCSKNDLDAIPVNTIAPIWGKNTTTLDGVLDILTCLAHFPVTECAPKNPDTFLRLLIVVEDSPQEAATHCAGEGILFSENVVAPTDTVTCDPSSPAGTADVQIVVRLFAPCDRPFATFLDSDPVSIDSDGYVQGYFSIGLSAYVSTSVLNAVFTFESAEGEKHTVTYRGEDVVADLKAAPLGKNLPQVEFLKVQAAIGTIGDCVLPCMSVVKVVLGGVPEYLPLLKLERHSGVDSVEIETCLPATLEVNVFNYTNCRANMVCQDLIKGDLPVAKEMFPSLRKKDAIEMKDVASCLQTFSTEDCTSATHAATQNAATFFNEKPAVRIIFLDASPWITDQCIEAKDIMDPREFKIPDCRSTYLSPSSKRLGAHRTVVQQVVVPYTNYCPTVWARVYIIPEGLSVKDGKLHGLNGCTATASRVTLTVTDQDTTVLFTKSGSCASIGKVGEILITKPLSSNNVVVTVSSEERRSPQIVKVDVLLDKKSTHTPETGVPPTMPGDTGVPETPAPPTPMPEIPPIVDERKHTVFITGVPAAGSGEAPTSQYVETILGTLLSALKTRLHEKAVLYIPTACRIPFSRIAGGILEEDRASSRCSVYTHKRAAWAQAETSYSVVLEVVIDAGFALTTETKAKLTEDIEHAVTHNMQGSNLAGVMAPPPINFDQALVAFRGMTKNEVTTRSDQIGPLLTAKMQAATGVNVFLVTVQSICNVDTYTPSRQLDQNICIKPHTEVSPEASGEFGIVVLGLRHQETHMDGIYTTLRDLSSDEDLRAIGYYGLYTYVPEERKPEIFTPSPESGTSVTTAVVVIVVLVLVTVVGGGIYVFMKKKPAAGAGGSTTAGGDGTSAAGAPARLDTTGGSDMFSEMEARDEMVCFMDCF